MRIVKVKPTRGETGFRDRRLCRGLSRVRGNLPARFLGEGATVTLLFYPTAVAGRVYITSGQGLQTPARILQTPARILKTPVQHRKHHNQNRLNLPVQLG